MADALQVSDRTARRRWHRHQEVRPEGLQTPYSQCGPKGPRAPAAVHAAAVELKQEHPTWGAGLIRLQFVAQCGEAAGPPVRALQRWFQAAGWQPARTQRPAGERTGGKEAHDVWEMDAQEPMRPGMGRTPAC